jgi:DNA-binding transcriptional LysR family regulator
MSGEIRIGIIPTLAPYLLPSLFKNIREKYPKVNLVVREIITEDVVQELKNNKLDCGIVVTPLKDPSIKEDVLFYEELFVYVSKKKCFGGQEVHITNRNRPLTNYGCWKRGIAFGRRFLICVSCESILIFLLNMKQET